MAVGLKLDANKEIRKLVRDFNKIPPDLRKELRPALKKGAQPILAEARSNASWSTRIPRATRIASSFTKRRGGVTIVVSAKRAPHGRPYENLGAPGTFRHPVFAHPRSRDMVFGREVSGAFGTGYRSRAATAKDRKRSNRRQAVRKGSKGTRWVGQTARPYLFRAVEERGEAVTQALAEMVIEIGRRHGWNR
ncbi:HK97 gp10 family phage protein [Streptosporangium sp. NPDC048865]|uniref:HK97 gp10 family phage protein n=1 Tax=Streptosporangium sp. NPDC048865 TaxID=3155766 RepID=UPI00342C1181